MIVLYDESMTELSATERIILAIDTSSEPDAHRLVALAKLAGAKFVKFGLELSSATSWRYCSELAAKNSLEWIADAKLDDIPNTVVGAVKNIKGLDYPPFGITMHTTAGIEAMKLAQETAGQIIMFGVTVLTSTTDEQAEKLYKVPVQQKVLELARDASVAGLKGIVCSPLEVGLIKSVPDTAGLLAMTPGVRSADSIHSDQSRVATPAESIKNGSDLIVVGRQITQAQDPAQAFADLVDEVTNAISQPDA